MEMEAFKLQSPQRMAKREKGKLGAEPGGGEHRMPDPTLEGRDWSCNCEIFAQELNCWALIKWNESLTEN